MKALTRADILLSAEMKLIKAGVGMKVHAPNRQELTLINVHQTIVRNTDEAAFR